ncbi:MAG: PPC domain-containing DNA-binding protein [Candidatus Heimdallarchaeaceae archaeon]|jgi:predicted DNA-binding protein with PD1-like motif
MKSISEKLINVHFIKMEKGEDILETIVNYCKKVDLKSGAIYGLGAVEKASLGFYDLNSKTYLTNDYDFNAEILNCTGNITKNKETGEYIAHIHMTIGDVEGKTFGGHLLPGNPISVTGEFTIFEIDSILEREVDDEFKLLLLSL